MTPRLAIIGCGLIGKKRAAALPTGTLAIVCDTHLDRAQALATLYPGVKAMSEWKEVAASPDIHGVIVATINSSLAEISRVAAAAGKAVLVEKPAGLTVAELESIQAAAATSGSIMRVGFNHRMHPALQRAHALAQSGALGPLMFLRGRYGHGGRVGYDREWRADPAVSGGGELIDQGVHLIDLARWFLGDFSTVEGHAGTYFWDMPVEDNAFLNLRTSTGQTAWLHASCSEWKNMFSMEIYGRVGKLQIDGLGGSYGVEKLTYYRMKPEMGPPDVESWDFPGPDESWKLENAAFIDDINQGRATGPGIPDAIATLRIVETIYARGLFPKQGGLA